jgi:hypothetical protein
LGVFLCFFWLPEKSPEGTAYFKAGIYPCDTRSTKHRQSPEGTAYYIVPLELCFCDVPRFCED